MAYSDYLGPVSAATLGYIGGNVRGAATAGLAYSKYAAAKRRRLSRLSNPLNARYTEVQARRKQRVKRTFKQKVMNVAESKHETFESVGTLPHNVIRTLNPIPPINQGPRSDQRIGDHIYLSALKIKGSYASPATSGTYQFRIIIGYSGEEYYPNTGSPNFLPVFGNGLGEMEVFHPITSTINRTNGIINAKAFTRLYDERIDVNSHADNAATIKGFSFDVQLNKDFYFQQPHSEYGKFKNLYIVIIGYALGGTGGADPTNAGNFAISYDLIYKDI